MRQIVLRRLIQLLFSFLLGTVWSGVGITLAFEESGTLFQRKASRDSFLQITQRQSSDAALRSKIGRLTNQIEELYSQGRYVEAVPLAEERVTLTGQVLGKEHRLVGVGIAQVANLLYLSGQYYKARGQYDRALKILQRVLGNDHPDVAAVLSGYAALMDTLGDHAEARELYERTIRILERGDGPGMQSMLAQNLVNLAGSLQSIGDHTIARKLYERGISIFERAEGSNSPYVADALDGLATLLIMIGNQREAQSLLQRALSIYEPMQAGKHLELAAALRHYAVSLYLSGNLAESRSLLQRALRVQEQAVGRTYPDVGRTLLGLAILGIESGDLVNARQLLRRALGIFEEAYGPVHPDIAYSLTFIALLEWHGGDVRNAAALLERAWQIDARHTNRGLIGLAERQKLAFLRTTEGNIANYLSLPSAQILSVNAYSAVSTWKNMAFRVLAQEREALMQIGEPTAQTLVLRRAELIRQFTGLVHGSGAGDAATRRQRIAEREREMEQVEAELSHASARFRVEQAEARAGTAEVCAALLPDMVLLDFLRYSRYTPAQPAMGVLGKREDSYTVFLLHEGRCKVVHRVELGPAAPIDQAVQAFRQALTEGATEAQLRPLVQALGILVLPPSVREALVGASTLLVAPDGALALVPFKLLPGDDGRSFLLETRTVATIPSGRDLLRLARKDEGEKPAAGLVLVGNPDYGTTVALATGGGDRLRTTTRAGCGLEKAAVFDPLPGTADEVRAIAGQASANMKGVTIRQAEGHTATEVWLSQEITGQRYVHLATHGYFAGESCTPPSTPSTRGVLVQAGLRDDFSGPVGTNPLLLSGIALAGANRRAQAQSGADDGILTALEVTGLDLRGTDLVVLSACETGLGAQQTGQELLGLRWAFGMAGARTLLTSLWKVPDEPTVKLMTKFYGYLWRSPKDGGPLGKAAALRQAQLDLIKENRARFNGDSRPNDWGAWVLSGDWR